MDNTEIILEKLDKLENKIDIIGNELNKSIISNEVVKEKTHRNEDDIKEIKTITIPDAVKSGNSRIKNWIYASFGLGGGSIILVVIKILMGL